MARRMGVLREWPGAGGRTTLRGVALGTWRRPGGGGSGVPKSPWGAGSVGAGGRGARRCSSGPFKELRNGGGSTPPWSSETCRMMDVLKWTMK